MRRTLNRMTEEGRQFVRKHESADLAASEICELIDSYETTTHTPGDAQGLFAVITAAYLAGVAEGARTERRLARLAEKRQSKV